MPIPRLKPHEGPAILSYGFAGFVAWKMGRIPLVLVLHLAALGWLTAFAGFAIAYAPALFRPRLS